MYVAYFFADGDIQGIALNPRYNPHRNSFRVFHISYYCYNLYYKSILNHYYSLNNYNLRVNHTSYCNCTLCPILPLHYNCSVAEHDFSRPTHFGSAVDLKLLMKLNPYSIVTLYLYMLIGTYLWHYLPNHLCIRSILNYTVLYNYRMNYIHMSNLLKIHNQVGQ